MKKVSVLATILTAALCISGNLLAYSDGTGEPNNPYQIASIADFQQLSATSDDWGKSFILTANLDFGGMAIIPVGGNNNGSEFTGIFDGNDNIISNAAIINQPLTNSISLFGHVGSGGQIRNLGVVNVNIEGSSCVGGLVGMNSGTLTACYVTGSVTGTGQYVGGLVGYNSGMLIACYVTGPVTGTDAVGGLAGENDGTLTGCYATGSISGTGGYVGGVAGHNFGTLTSCYATGSVRGNGYVGGLAGYNFGTLTSCYATGSVDGTGSYVGGLVGMNTNEGTIAGCYAAGGVDGTSDTVGGLVGRNLGEATGCFWDIQTSGRTATNGGMGLTTAVMQNPETYLRFFWDFEGEVENGISDIWAMPAGGGYPVFAWQVGNSPVSNDEMYNAIVVTAGSTISSTSIGATGLDLTTNGYKDSTDVWYYFDCASVGKYTLTVQPDGFNSTLGVFDAAQYEIVFNDDFFGEKSAVILNAVAGQRYYIRVAGYNGQTGNFGLTLAQGAIQAIQGDLNYDGMVNLVDFSMMAENWLIGM